MIGGTRGSHILLKHDELLRRLDGKMIYFEADDGRICLVFDYMGRALVGSTDVKADNPDDVRCEDWERGPGASRPGSAGAPARRRQPLPAREGGGASGGLGRAAPAAAHAAGDPVAGPPRRASVAPGSAATASTCGLRHRTSGVGTGASDIASTSASIRAGSASTFRNMSPTRRVARSEWATTTSTSSMGDQYPGGDRRRRAVIRVRTGDQACRLMRLVARRQDRRA